MNNKQSSAVFWLIFLVIILAIAFIIFPKYGRLSQQLNLTQSRNLATKLTSASAANYTQRRINNQIGVAVSNCQDVKRIPGNTLPLGYQISNKQIDSDKVGICLLKSPNGRQTEFSVMGIH